MRFLQPVLVAVLLAVSTTLAGACPFCTIESRTLTEELADCECAVLARLVKPAAAETLGLNDQPQDDVPFGTVDPETGAATFRVDSVLLARGETLAPEPGETLEAIYFGEPNFETMFLLRGLDDPLNWAGAIPLKLSPAAVEYVKRLQTLPESGADRLAFFQQYFQHEDKLLAQDAYDEFARAPYADVKALRDRMDREQLLEWIESPTISPSRRRLYLTMLGVCGGPEDVPRIERLLLSDTRALTPAAEAGAALSLAMGGPLSVALTPESVRLDGRRQKLGLDAMVACYLVLRGGEGLDVIDDRFLKDDSAEYSQVYYTLMAIRFLAEESDLVPRDRLLQSARLLLDNRDFADQVIPDLARWKDWAVLDQLVTMFKGTVAPKGEAPKFEKYVRDPIVTYLDIAAKEEGRVAEQASVALAELEPIAPDSFRRARAQWNFGALGRAFAKKPPAERQPKDGSADLGPAIGSAEIAVAEPAAPIDAPPSPAAFAAARGGASEQAGGEAASIDPSADEPSPPLSVPEPESSVDAGAAAASVAAPKAIDPPAGWLLVGAPLMAFAACFGLFWAVLNNGA